MTTVTQTDFARNWQDIAANLLKLGATAYHHGHHAGRAPGKAAVGLQRTVRRRPLARQYVAGRERGTAQHVFGLRPRGVTVIALMVWRVGTVNAMLLGSLLGVLRSRVSSLRAAKGDLYTFTRTLGTAS